jgi:hypothetical protein
MHYWHLDNILGEGFHGYVVISGLNESANTESAPPENRIQGVVIGENAFDRTLLGFVK